MLEPPLKRTISRTSAILLVVSVIVGSGVFKKVAPMASELHSPVLILVCWLVAGVVSLMGALSNAELASMMPNSGGEYVYFKKIYGKFFSFLYGWGNFTVMKTATIAALAYIFAESVNALFPLPEVSISVPGSLGLNVNIKIIASLLIASLSYINHRGVILSEKLSRYFIIGIVVAIAAFALAAVFSGKGNMNNFEPGSNVPQGWMLFTAFFAASTSAFWGYEGWNCIGYIGEEIKNPQKNIPLALGIGTIAVIVLYLIINSVYVYILPIGELEAIHHSTNKIAAVEVAIIISGNAGGIVISVLILVTTFNCTNSTILTSARVFYAMARDGLFLRDAGKIHETYNTPSRAIAWQGLWSIVLIWSGSFDQLTDLLIFASFIFYGATAFGVIILRRRDPEALRPYRVIGYPFLPFLFSAFCLVLICVTIISQPWQAFIGLMLILSGAPVYYYYTQSRKIM